MTLYICYTPLHALITRAILKKEENAEAKVVYICFTDNSKNRHYADLLKENADLLYVVLRHCYISDFFNILSLANRIKNSWGSITRISSGNIKHSHTRWLAFFLNVNEFESFDDGSGNISGKGYFYEEKESSVAGKVLTILDVSYSYKSILSSLVKHYTIYDVPNVVEKYSVPTTRIAFLNENMANIPDKAVSVYLSNAFSSDGLMTKKEEDELDTAIVNKFDVDFIIPHPRRFLSEMPQLIYKTNLIAEDAIVELVKDGHSVKLYGIYSSTLLNLSSVVGVKCINIKYALNKPTEGIESAFSYLGISSISI